ncbi:MAG: M23 family metallopeptidase [Candidatus Cryptobacteroides sp.]
MSRFSKYVYNPDTLMYERQEDSKFHIALKVLLFAGTVVLLVFFYFWFYTRVLGLDLPKTARLKKENAAWVAKFELLNHELDMSERLLDGIEKRDDDVYRSIFGLEDIPQEVKQAGFGGVNRYSYLDDFGASALLKSTVKRLDVLTKRSYIQSKALDEVALVSKQADQLSSCMPSVPPINPIPGSYRISSGFGYRMHPIKQRRIFHDGLDFATGKVGPGVYATGDGEVEKVRYNFFGYGNEVVINHGFGYKTRYAHLKDINVKKGQKVKRGEQIGTVGNTGQSTGPHLHYEVLYKTKPIDPAPFMDLTMKPDEYQAMVEKIANENERS